MVKYSESYWTEAKKVIGEISDLGMLSKKNVLVTGASGMICSTFVELLFVLNNFHNTGIKFFLAGRNREKIVQRFNPFNEGKDYYFVQYNTECGLQQPLDVDYIIHGASPADPASFAKYPVETMLSNIMGLQSLLNLVKKSGNTRLLFISSSEVYGRKIEKRPFIEKDYGYVDILNPRACYPSSKRAAETMCAAYQQEYGIDFVIVRPGHIYGPSITDSDSRASAQFTRRAKAGENIIMKSAGMQLRSYCYTMDCASAILTVLLKGASGEAYNISNPQSIVTIRDFAESMAKKAGVRVIFEQASDQELKSYNMMDNSSLDSNKLEYLGWKGMYDLEKGIEATLNFFV